MMCILAHANARKIANAMPLRIDEGDLEQSIVSNPFVLAKYNDDVSAARFLGFAPTTSYVTAIVEPRSRRSFRLCRSQCVAFIINAGPWNGSRVILRTMLPSIGLSRVSETKVAS
jgi:hypothetical protein